MKRPLLSMLALFLLLLVAACTSPGTTGFFGGGANNGDDPKSFPGIRLYNSKLGVGDYLVEVNSVGEMTVQEHRGGNDPEVHRSSMHLSPDQIAALQSAFKGWKQLSPDYPGEWSTLVEITYDGYLVRAHDLDQTPKNFTQAMATIVNLARTTVATASTAPAPATPAPTTPVAPTAPAPSTPSPILVPRY